MRTSDFDYELPQELIAQTPVEPRDHCRLMVARADGSPREDHLFYEVIDELHAGDCLVINETRVIPARLLGVKEETGVPVEVLLLRRQNANEWEALVRPGRRLKPGTWCSFGDGLLRCEILGNVPETGGRFVRFSYEGVFEELLDRLGEMPLPPYIHEKLEDPEKYQTVYAKQEGSAAAPTAGLHFTEELLNRIREKGVSIVPVLLHVGLGTFRPVKEDNIEDHPMHSEFCIVTQETADLVNRTHQRGGRVIAVGTTSCRTLESFTDENGILQPKSGWTDIFIYPGYRFKAIDALITNFHLPESTLIMLVSALAGRESILDTYREAVNMKYRFFSFGDAMLIE
jgi:S-adenosylmethionine:tRNA ribosyltransferase-isomerase